MKHQKQKAKKIPLADKESSMALAIKALDQIASQLLIDTAHSHQDPSKDEVTTGIQDRLSLTDTKLPNINLNQAKTLQKYAELLNKWNDVYNLSALKSANDIYVLHLLDCLSAFKGVTDILQSINASMPQQIKCLDVGSGAGLPGLIWAILMQEKSANTDYSSHHDWQFTNIDAVQKKIAFQQQVCLDLGLKNAQPQHQRIEKLEGAFDFITARAYSNIEKLLSDTLHLRDYRSPHNGYFLLKGQLNEELLSISKKYPSSIIKKLDVPYLIAERHLIYIPFSDFNI
jgi:16S rRNA (guanine527-N7)-methyltransferase